MYLLKGKHKGRKEQPVWGPRAIAAKGAPAVSILPLDLFLIFLFFFKKIKFLELYIEFPGIQDVFPSPKFHWADSLKRKEGIYTVPKKIRHMYENCNPG